MYVEIFLVLSGCSLSVYLHYPYKLKRPRELDRTGSCPCRAEHLHLVGIRQKHQTAIAHGATPEEGGDGPPVFAVH